MSDEICSPFFKNVGKNLDFTMMKYHQLLKSIKESDYVPITVLGYLEKENSSQKRIVLRHDVDLYADHALKMAKLEHSLGISSTYYFRMKKNTFVPSMIKEVSRLGHEIGYHYEVLDKAKGDYEKAIEIFGHELDQFRQIADVKTVCMHGNPFTPYLNRDLWKQYDLSDFSLVGEPYLSIDYDKVLYFSDTSRSWCGKKASVKDTVESERRSHVCSTDDLIKFISKSKESQICLLSHPVRWSVNCHSWLCRSLLENGKKIGKRGIVYFNHSNV